MDVPYEIHPIETAAEMEQAFLIRQQVFVIEQEVNPEEEYDEFEDSSFHYLATWYAKPVATARFRQTDYGIKFERFAVLEEARGVGIGGALVKRLLEDTTPVNSNIYLHAQVQVIQFYEKYGFVAVGDEFIEADIRHRKMVFSK